ncbi:MAG: TonB-dependent receptor [Pseudomonadales bacterium]
MKLKYLPVAIAAISVLPAISVAQPLLEEMIVTSSRIEMPLRNIGTSISVINQADIELSGYASLFDILSTQPGIAVSNSGGMGKVTALRVRGEESFRTLVILDGIRLSDPTGTQVGPQIEHIMATGNIERVEILRGPQGLMYGADAGGVINIISAMPDEGVSGKLSAEAGSFDSRKIDANIAAASEQFDVSLSGQYVETEGFDSRELGEASSDDDGYENNTLHARVGWNLSDDLRLQLIARSVDATSEYDGCFYSLTHDCTTDSNQDNLRITANYQDDVLSHKLAFERSDIDRRNFDDGIESYATQGESSRSEYLGSWRLNDSNSLVYGFDLENQDVVNNAGQTYDRTQRGYYLEYQGLFLDGLSITGGVRHDDLDDFGNHNSFRITAAYVQELGDGQAVKYRSSYGTGFRAPSLSEQAYNDGPYAWGPAAGLQLIEESSSGFDIGMEYFLDNGLHLELVYFDQKVDDEIYFDLVYFYGYLQSLGTTKSKGVELAALVPLGDNWQLKANYTYNDTETPDGLQRIRRPSHIGNIGVQYNALQDKLRISANWRFSADAQDEQYGVGRIPLDDYQVLDISANYAVTDALEVYGRIENITDEYYQEVTSYNSAPRAAYAGIRYQF